MLFVIALIIIILLPIPSTSGMETRVYSQLQRVSKRIQRLVLSPE
jgi:hypothetical protein